MIIACFWGTESRAHDCPNQVIIERGDCNGGDIHDRGAVLARRIPNHFEILSRSETSNSHIIGAATYQNEFNDRNRSGRFNVNVSVTESWGVTVGISHTLKAETRSVIIPIGASWETTVHAEGEWGHTKTKQWIAEVDMDMGPCERHRAQISESNIRISTTTRMGDLEYWTYTCDDGSPSQTVLLCNTETASASSSRYEEQLVSIGWGSPRRVPGCHTTDDDSDGDGVKNGDDPDVDGDGIDNGDDPDIDGDGIPNDQDSDMDGDGIDNNQDMDMDMDGDGQLNADDDDIDGDGIPNDEDPDMDGDGVDNEVDDDTDGDGVPNDQDEEPNGTSGSGGWLDVFIDLINRIIRILQQLN